LRAGSIHCQLRLGGVRVAGINPAAIAAITGMACPVVAVGSATYTCSATAITAPPAAAGAASVSYAPSALVTDTANAATPAATTTTDPASMRTDTLFVNAPLLVTLTQNAITNPPSLIPGAANRSYGTVGAAPTYTGKGGLGARTPSTYEWCVNTGASSLPAGLGGIGTSCSPAFTTTGAATETLTASNISATITPPSQNFSFTVELTTPATPARQVASAAAPP